VDAYFAQIEADFYNGIQHKPASIIEIIRDPSGSVHQFTYQSVALRYEEAGTWEGEKYVQQKVAFVASKRVQNS
jgi:hypothetical protein